MNVPPASEAFGPHDICPVCPVCDRGFQQSGRGRPRIYCSDSCRQEAHVRRRIERAGGTP